MKTALTGGPNTRSRSNVITAPEKDGTEKIAPEKEARNSILIEPPAPIHLPPNEGIGSMAAYLAMRERQKTENTKKKTAITSKNGTPNESVDPENVLPDMRGEVEEG